MNKNQDQITVSETILLGIRAAIIDAIENTEPEEGLASAEYALALLNHILAK